MDILALAALHKHFLAADAVKQFVFAKIPTDAGKYALPPQMEELAQELSAMLRLQVFYSLLYVVVEGYKELGCTDAAVDGLLADTDYVDGLRRFRNANFHYQEDPFSPKLVEFLHAKGSETWTRDLYGALNEFFTVNLRLKEVVQALQSDLNKGSS